MCPIVRTGAITDLSESHRVLVQGMGPSNANGHTGHPSGYKYCRVAQREEKRESLQVMVTSFCALGSLSVSMTWKGKKGKKWDGLSTCYSSGSAAEKQALHPPLNPPPDPPPSSPTAALRSQAENMDPGPWSCSRPSPASTPTLR